MLHQQSLGFQHQAAGRGAHEPVVSLHIAIPLAVPHAFDVDAAIQAGVHAAAGNPRVAEEVRAAAIEVDEAGVHEATIGRLQAVRVFAFAIAHEAEPEPLRVANPTGVRFLAEERHQAIGRSE